MMADLSSHVNEEKIIKLIFVGDVAVGKTSLIRRFLDDVFTERPRPTMGVHVFIKEIDLPAARSSETILLQLWDLSAHSHYDVIRPSYYAGATGVVYVADVTREETICHLDHWVRDVTNHVDSRTLAHAVALNKFDLVSLSETSHERDAWWTEIRDCLPKTLRDRRKVFYTSAKHGINISETITCVLSQVLPPFGNDQMPGIIADNVKHFSRH